MYWVYKLRSILEEYEIKGNFLDNIREHMSERSKD